MVLTQERQHQKLKAPRSRRASGRVLCLLASAIAGLFLAGLLFVTPQASAAGESISIQTSMVPFGGKLYRELPVPVNSRLEVNVAVPETQSTVLPMKRATIKFDTDMTYNPRNRVTPACPDSKIGQNTNLGLGVALVVDLCPRSVIGTGSAIIYLAKQKTAVLSDPQMVIFNAGRDRHGNPKLKIYGYSKGTGAGLLMEGSLTRRGIQDVPIGVLSYDSGVGNFVFDLPGNGMPVEDVNSPGGIRMVRGLDRRYVQARCSDNLWTTGGDFILGERDPATGADIGPDTLVSAAAFNDPCRGIKGRARLSRVSLKGWKSGKRHRRITYRVRVANRGTATARRVRIMVSGAARGRFKRANIAPRTSRTMVVRPRITAAAGRRARVVLKVRASKTQVRFSTRVRVRR